MESNFTKKLKASSVSTLAIALLSVTVSGCGGGGSGDSTTDQLANSPYQQGHEGAAAAGETNFANLINNYAQAKPKRQPWAAHWWPYTANGIAAATNNGSPAGKYDAARGGTTHAQEWEVSHHGSKTPKVEGWWGHCDGWSAAAALYPEPRQPVTVNGIEFGVADQKALLTEAGSAADYDFFGNKMDNDDPNDPRYQDTVPNQFFSLITNHMGKNGDVVNIDRYTGYQVWNQPMMGYRFDYPKPSDYIGADPSAPNVYRVLFHVTIWWANDSGITSPSVLTPDFNWEDDPVDGTIEHRDLAGELWLDGPVQFDGNGKITSSGNLLFSRNPKTGFVVGGAWHMDNVDMEERWPDYMWLPYAIPRPDMNDPEWPANPWVDIQWLQDHILNGGADDTSVHPVPVPTVPTPEPSSSSDPHPNPSGIPTELPTPVHTDPTPTPTPTHTAPTPVPVPTNPAPVPTTPAPTPHG
jgi:hypothetical protein